MIGLCEIKTKKMECSSVYSIWGNYDCHCTNSDATVNGSGILLLIWDPQYFESHSCLKNDKLIINNGILKDYNWPCVTGLIYGGNTKEEKETIFYQIKNAIQNFSNSPLLFGHFNETLYVSKRKVQTRGNVGMRFLQNGRMRTI